MCRLRNQVTLYKDGALVGSLTPRQIPGAAAGGYTTDRTVLPPGRYVIKYTGGGFQTYIDDSRPTEWKQWEVKKQKKEMRCDS